MARIATDDKVVQIYLEGLGVLATCLAPPVCGNDIHPNEIQKKVNAFLPKLLKKISETNLKSRDNSIKVVIDIFRHPALNVGDLVKSCMDIVENPNSVTPDKQPWNVLLARLEVILHVLEEYGIDESLWDWYPVLTELIIPSLLHQNIQCRTVSINIVVLLYKMVGDDIKNIIGGLKDLKMIKETILNKISDVDRQNKFEQDKQLEANYLKMSNNSLKNSAKLKNSANTYDSIKEEPHEHELDHDDAKSKKNFSATKNSGFNSSIVSGRGSDKISNSNANLGNSGKNNQNVNSDKNSTPRSNKNRSNKSGKSGSNNSVQPSASSNK